MLGSLLIVLGTFTASLCTQYWQLLLAQGVCVGLGNGCLFCPSVALVSTYFARRRALAIGITACGGTTGGVVFPLLVRGLLPSRGFGWAMRAIGFIQLGTLALVLVLLRPNVRPRRTGALVEWRAFRELEYTFYAMGSFMVSPLPCLCSSTLGCSSSRLILHTSVSGACTLAFFFIAAYARDIQGMSYTASLNLVIIMNAIGVVGRLVPNYFADRVGGLTMFIPTAGATAILMFCWIPVSSPGGLYAWATVCGIGIAGIQSQFPSALAALTADPQKQGTRIGMVFTIVSFAVLTGPPIMGALIALLDGRYVGAQAFAGACFVVGTGFCVAAREIKRRKLKQSMWDKV